MNGPSDVPNIPLKKPRALEKLEKQSSEILNAMTPVELDEKIEDVARALAENYAEQMGKDATYDGCLMVVSEALTQTGASIENRKTGDRMIGTCDAKAKEACKILFPDEFGINEIEY